MKHCVYILLGLVLLVSCDSVVNEPEFSIEELYFNKEGGEQIVEVLKHGGKRYENDKHAPWFYSPLERGDTLNTKILLEKSRLGWLVFYNDWISFTVTPDSKMIIVNVKENKSDTTRKYTFHGSGKMSQMSLNVYQK